MENIKSAKLTRKERRQLAKEERARLAEERKKSETRYKTEKSAQQVIPIKDIHNGVVITQDNRFVRIMEFKPLNFAYMSPQAQNGIISMFASMLKTVPCNIQIKTFARKADVEASVANLRHYYEEEQDPRRKKMLKAYTDHILHKALSVGITRRFFVVIEFTNSVSNDGSDFNRVCADLESVAATVKTGMEQAGNVFLPTCDDDEGVHRLFYQLLNRRKSETVSFQDHMNSTLDRYLEACKDEKLPAIGAAELVAPAWMDFTHAKHMVIDDKFYTFAYIPSDGYLTQVRAGWLALFVNAAEGIDVDIFMTRYPREKVYDKIGNQVKYKRVDALDSHDTDRDYHQRLDGIASGEYLMEGLSHGEDFYYLSTLITIVADSLEELDYKYKELEKRAKGNGMNIRRANLLMEECCESMLPIVKLNPTIEAKAHRNVLTSGAASCYPFIAYEMQDPDGIMIGTNKANNSLVSINMFNTDIHPNANAVIVGSSGYGKTFTAQMFALRMSLTDVQTFVIAPLKGVEDYKAGCDAVAGQFVSMDPASSNCINIMDIRVPDDEAAKLMDGYEAAGSLLTKKIHTIKTFMNLVVRDLTQEEEQLLDTCLYEVYGKFGITNDNASLYDERTKEYRVMPLLGDLYEEMKSQPELHRVRNILSPLINGSLASFNRHTNVDLSAKYIVFDFNGLKGEVLVMSMFIVLDFVWNKIRENRKDKKAVFIDECWKLIGTDSNQRAAEDVVEIFRTIRAYGGSAFAMTQDVSQFFDYQNGKYGKAVIGNADTKIILHLDPNEAYKLQDAVQLTESETEAVMKLGKGQALVTSSGSKLFVDVSASEHEKNVITTDPSVFYARAKAEAMQKAKKV